MPKDNSAYLKHIRDSIYRIEIYISGIDKSIFLDDLHEMVRAAVVRELEIIGEAANATEQNFRETNKNLPWRDMIDTRNKIIHDYMSVDYELVWDIIIKDLPPLKIQVETLVGTK